MSSSLIQDRLPEADLEPGLTYYLPQISLDSAPGIDDPVNDTGLGPHLGDLQISAELRFWLIVI